MLAMLSPTLPLPCGPLLLDDVLALRLRRLKIDGRVVRAALAEDLFRRSVRTGVPGGESKSSGESDEVTAAEEAEAELEGVERYVAEAMGDCIVMPDEM